MNIAVLGTETPLGRAFLAGIRAAPDAEATPIAEGGLPVGDATLLAREFPDCDAAVNCLGDLETALGEAPGRGRFTEINLKAAENIAVACSRRRIKLVHFSTVHVFDGARGLPYTERDTPNPLNHFGTVKLAADKGVRGTGGPYLVVRLPLVYGEGGQGLVEQLVHSIRETRAAQASADAVICPTWSRTIADLTLRALRNDKKGLLNLSAAGSCTPVELAREIARILGVEASISTVERQGAGDARASRYCVLDTTVSQSWTGVKPPAWQDDLALYLRGGA